MKGPQLTESTAALSLIIVFTVGIVQWLAAGVHIGIISWSYAIGGGDRPGMDGLSTGVRDSVQLSGMDCKRENLRGDRRFIFFPYHSI